MITQENIFSDILTVNFTKQNSGGRNHFEWKIKVVIPKTMNPMLYLSIGTSYIFKGY